MSKEQLLAIIMADFREIMDKYLYEEHAIFAINVSLAVSFLGLQIGLNKGDEQEALKEVSKYINMAMKFKPKK